MSDISQHGRLFPALTHFNMSRQNQNMFNGQTHVNHFCETVHPNYTENKKILTFH